MTVVVSYAAFRLKVATVKQCFSSFPRSNQNLVKLAENNCKQFASTSAVRRPLLVAFSLFVDPRKIHFHLLSQSSLFSLVFQSVLRKSNNGKICSGPTFKRNATCVYETEQASPHMSSLFRHEDKGPFSGMLSRLFSAFHVHPILANFIMSIPKHSAVEFTLPCGTCQVAVRSFGESSNGVVSCA